MIELIDVTVSRGQNLVVRDLDLRIEPGSIFWIVGPNGAGKSSLLRVLAGIDRPRAGHVHHRGPPDETPHYFHSEMRIPDSATTGDWGRLAHQLLDARGDRFARSAARPAMDPPSAPAVDPTVGPGALWPTVDHRRLVRRLSTGERKRLLLDVLLRDGRALILDEPFEHLSPDAKRTLADRLRERARSRVVVVATNQATHRARTDGGLRLEAGLAVPLEAVPGPATPTPARAEGSVRRC